MRPDRRQVLAAIGTAPLTATPLAAAAAPPPGRAVFLYDPALPGAGAAAEAAKAGGARIVAVAGDRVRLARTLLADAPSRIAGMTRDADRLVLIGEAEAQGYRAVPAAGRGWAAARRG